MQLGGQFVEWLAAVECHVMYMCVRGIDLVFLHFRTGLTVWYFSFCILFQIEFLRTCFI